MAQLNFNIQGFSKLQEKIKRLPKELQEEVVGQIQAWGADVNKEQQALISQQNIVDNGALRLKTKSFNDPAGVTLLSDVYYAPFVEFGTGAKVNVPAELNEYALQFKGKSKGNFRDFVKALQIWLKRKGGNPKLAFIVALNIIKNGQEARPYFFPPYFRKRRELLKNIQEVIKKSL